MKILLRLPLSTYSGYGRDGIGLARALMRWGADVYLDPNVVQAPLPEDVAMLLTKPLEAQFDLSIHHVDPGSLNLAAHEKMSSRMNIAWSMWEWSNFKNLRGRSTLKSRLAGFDAVLAYDPVTKGCFEDYYKGPIPILQGGYEPDEWKYDETRDWFSDRWGFAMVGQLHERKDPFVAIQAFQELKNDPNVEFDGAELHLKTNAPGLHKAMEEVIPKLRIHYATWSNEVLRAFYGVQHVLLAPSRGEGKNLPALEMQSTGGTVIATNWGGHTQWLDSSMNYALDYVLADDPEYPGVYNARASVEHLKELMLHTYQNRAEPRDKGRLASQTIPKMCSWDAVVEKLFLRLREIDGGDRLWHLAQGARRSES